MRRGRDSVPIVMEEEKHGTSASIHTSRSWAVPGPLLFPCLSQRDEWPTACGWHPGEEQHPSLSRLPCGNVPTQGEAFPWCYSSRDAALPKPVDWVPVASRIKIADILVKHGRVFTAGPTPANPYTIQFSRYYLSLLVV